MADVSLGSVHVAGKPPVGKVKMPGKYRLALKLVFLLPGAIPIVIVDVEDMYRVTFDLEDVETVGGLLASALGRVPIPGATVTLQGLTFTAEGVQGRRNQVGTVLISR